MIPDCETTNVLSRRLIAVEIDGPDNELYIGGWVLVARVTRRAVDGNLMVPFAAGMGVLQPKRRAVLRRRYIVSGFLESGAGSVDRLHL